MEFTERTSIDHDPNEFNIEEMMATIKKHAKRMQDHPVVVLFVVHPADYQWLKDNIKEKTRDTFPLWTVGDQMANFAMGIPVWRSAGIERGKPKSYRSWEAAYEDLKGLVVPGIDMDFLARRAKMEVENAIS